MCIFSVGPSFFQIKNGLGRSQTGSETLGSGVSRTGSTSCCGTRRPYGSGSRRFNRWDVSAHGILLHSFSKIYLPTIYLHCFLQRKYIFGISISPFCTEKPMKFTANLYCICLSIPQEYTEADAVQICGKFWDTQY